MRILHVEDNVYKHSDIVKQLSEMRITDITWAQTYEDGVSELEVGPFDLLITDMSFPIRRGEPENSDAGDMMIDYALQHFPEMAIILITSFRMRKDNIFGVVHYDPDELWENRFRDLVAKCRTNAG